MGNGKCFFLLVFIIHVPHLRVKTKMVISFLKGLLSSFHLKCKKLDFIRSLEEAKMYLSRQKLPKNMLQLRNGVGTDLGGDSDEDEGSGGSKKCLSTEIVQRFKGSKSGPFIVGDLEVLKLGKMVKDLDCFDDEESICPLGYTATRKFPSLADPSICSVYKMEVLRDADINLLPPHHRRTYCHRTSTSPPIGQIANLFGLDSPTVCILSSILLST